MAKKRTKTKAKEPIKIWVKPLKNGNKAIYLRTYQAGSKGRGYTYERLKGLLLVDDKRGSDKEAKAKNEATLRTAMLIRCERIRESSDFLVQPFAFTNKVVSSGTSLGTLT